MITTAPNTPQRVNVVKKTESERPDNLQHELHCYILRNLIQIDQVQALGSLRYSGFNLFFGSPNPNMSAIFMKNSAFYCY